MGSVMQKFSGFCAGSFVLAASMAFAAPVLISGCGGSGVTEMVKGDEPPRVALKDSMSYYRDHMSHKATTTKKTRR